MFLQWRFVRQFPKFAVVAGVFIVSTVLFSVWWMWFSPWARRKGDDGAAQRRAYLAQQAALIEERAGRLFLAGNDLYDAGTGEVLLKNWLGGDMPSNLFYEPDTKTYLARFPRGLTRYNLDGSQQTSLAMRYTVAFSDHFSQALYAKDKDIWQAPVHLTELKLGEEKQVTKMGIFYERYLIENIVLATGKILVLLHENTLLRINLESGEVKPTALPLQGYQRRLSPDGKRLIDTQGSTLYLYDVETEETKTHPLGGRRVVVIDYLWIGPERCALLVGGQAVAFYDASKNALEEATPLPVPCQVLGGVSPDGKFLLCGVNRHNPASLAFEIETKKIETLPGGLQGVGWASGDSLLFMREIPDSSLRGTWLKKLGHPEIRITEDPYLVTHAGGSLALPLPEAGWAVFVTRQGICRIKPDGSDFKLVATVEKTPARLIAIQEFRKP